MAAGVIQVREIQHLGVGQWKVEIKHDAAATKRNLLDPASANLSLTQLKWLLEDYPQRFPFDHEQAATFSARLDKYARDLVLQLDLSKLIQTVLSSESAKEIILELVDKDADSGFHAIHWELLERYLHQPERLSVSVRRVVEPTPPPAVDLEEEGDPTGAPNTPDPIQRPYNVLLVVARPKGKEDIDPLLGSRELEDVLTEMFSHDEQRPVRLEIARPGTWTAFEEHVTSRTEAWHARGGRGNWFDIVHFDVHGIVHDGSGRLQFVSSSGKRILLRSAEQIADVLTRNEVPLVVMNACESANATTVLSNLARTLVDKGVYHVVGMSFELTGTAAKAFIRAFYSYYFAAGDRSFLAAAHHARQVLQEDEVRLGKLDRPVFVPDFFIPVVYSCAGVADTRKALPGTTNNPEGENHPPIGDSPSRAMERQLQKDTIGREHDILRMEWMLLRKDKPRVGLVFGAIGAGKTTLVKLLSSWWLKTELISKCHYWSLRDTPLSKVLKILRVWNLSRDASSNNQREAPRLFILDDLDAVTGSEAPQVMSLDEGRRDMLLDLLNGYRNQRDLVILVSRSPEDWCQLEKSQKHQLSGLSHADALVLACRIMKDTGWGHFLDLPATMRDMECFINRVAYLPLSIEFWLRQSPREVSLMRDGPQAHDWVLTDARPDNVLPDTPEHLLRFMLLGSLMSLEFPPNLSICQEAVEYIARLWYADERNQAVLLSLGPVAGIYSEDWYDSAIDHWSQQANIPFRRPDADYYKTFVTEKLINVGWAQVVKTIVKGGVEHRYIWIHTILTNALRTCARANEGMMQLEEGVLLPFTLHETAWAYTHTDYRGLRDWKEEIQLRTTSLLASYSLSYNLTVLNQCRILQPYYPHVILHLLWFTALASSTPALTPGMLRPQMFQLLQYVENRLDAGHEDRSQLFDDGLFGTNIDVLLRTGHVLSDDMLYKSRHKCMAIIQRVLRRVAHSARTGCDWDFYSRRNQLSRCLLSLGYCLLQENKFRKAQRLASLALRCHRPMPNKVEQLWDVHIASKAYYILLMAALEQQHPKVVTDWYAKQAEAAHAFLESAKSAPPYDFFAIQPQFNLIDAFKDSSERLEPSNEIEMRTASRIKNLIAQGKSTEMTETFIGAIIEAQKTGNTMAEGQFHAELAELCMESRDWTGAAQHIDRLDQLFHDEDRGAWSVPHHYDISQTYDDLFRYARYGSVFLRQEEFQAAIIWFYRALRARSLLPFDTPTFPDEPGAFIDVAMTITRGALCVLVSRPRELISPPDFNELDDTMQRLITEYVVKEWPNYDQDNNELSSRLRRSLDLVEHPDPDKPPRADGSDLNGISLTEMVFKLCRRGDGTQTLTLAFCERHLVAGPAEDDGEEDDPVIDTIEELVAFSSELISSERPRCYMDGQFVILSKF